MKLINISRPSIGKTENDLVLKVLESGWLTQGPMVAAFEEEFSRRHNVRHAIAVTSCTAGLHMTLASRGIGPGDEVIVPSFTWIASANAVVACGATPVLVDVDRNTFNIDPAAILPFLSERTKAIIPVHLFGLCADIDDLRAALPASVEVIEDAACAVGATYKGQSAGSLGLAGVFSFHPRKSITTGEGGIITTNNDELAEQLKQLRNHGATIPEETRHTSLRPHQLPDFPSFGFNYRMSDLQGAVGLAQVRRLDQILAYRRRLVDVYYETLSTLNWLVLPSEPDTGQHGWQAYVTYVDPTSAPLSAAEIMDRMSEKGIACRPGTHAVHMQQVYKNTYGYENSDLPGARDCANNTLALPLHTEMTEADVQRIAATLISMDS